MSVRPERERKSSRVPGSFDTGDDVGSMSDDPFDSQNHGGPLPDSSFQPASPDGTSLLPPFDENSALPANNTVMEERAMNRKLMDVESSFLPELSHLAAPNGRAEGADNTFAFGVPNDNLAMRRRTAAFDGQIGRAHV